MSKGYIQPKESIVKAFEEVYNEFPDTSACRIDQNSTTRDMLLCVGGTTQGKLNCAPYFANMDVYLHTTSTHLGEGERIIEGVNPIENWEVPFIYSVGYTDLLLNPRDLRINMNLVGVLNADVIYLTFETVIAFEEWKTSAEADYLTYIQPWIKDTPIVIWAMRKADEPLAGDLYNNSNGSYICKDPFFANFRVKSERELLMVVAKQHEDQHLFYAQEFSQYLNIMLPTTLLELFGSPLPKDKGISQDYVDALTIVPYEDPETKDIVPLLVGQTEVTVGLYESVMGVSLDDLDPGSKNRPYHLVDERDLSRFAIFCNKLSIQQELDPCYRLDSRNRIESFYPGSNGYRMLSEDEWHYIGQANRQFKYSGSDDLDTVAWYRKAHQFGVKKHDVGLKQLNSFGTYDQVGNLAELCGYAPYSNLVYLGGSYLSNSISFGWSMRHSHVSDFEDLGIRIARLPSNPSGKYLRRAVLSGVNLEGVNFEGVDLEGADLTNAKLQDANLQDANLQGATLHYANLQGANLDRGNLDHAELDLANLESANLESAKLRFANLEEANFRGAKLRGANLENANFQGANLEYANLLGANLEGANLRDANLQGAILRGANLQGALTTDIYFQNLGAYYIGPNANLEGANLQGANLQSANLYDANLLDANLQDANLQGVYLENANLQGANLQGADLQGANLTNANLEGANLQGANLYRTYFGYARIQNANLQGANLRDANLRGANLEGANLEGVKFYQANLEDANLQNANLQGADLRYANLEGVNLEGVNLKDADLTSHTRLLRAKLQNANLEGAKFFNSNLSEANLRDAKIEGAIFARVNFYSAIVTQKELQTKEGVYYIGAGANLQGADLVGADLKGVNLEGADLKGVNLEGANLEGANLKSASMVGSYIGDCILTNTNFEDADMRRVNFAQVHFLEGANFQGADLRNARYEEIATDFRGSNITQEQLASMIDTSPEYDDE